MNLFISKVVNSLIQIIIFTLIPFIWWLVTARRKESFFSWIGIKRATPENKKQLWSFTFFVTAGFMVVSVFVLYILKGTTTATSEFSGKGIVVLPAVLIYAFFNTALPEEILFRGFLLKRLEHKLGFSVANIIQSIIFGIMHGIMFISLVSVGKAVIIILLTGSIAWFMGYINEKKANGSIYTSWLIHGLSNVFSALVSMFSLI
jgi:membrane protease YdiL (CAAX protease family)